MSTQQPSSVALSIKQPWAGLILAGLKTMEIRRWPTVRRGRILIHASQVPDNRVEAWEGVPAEFHELTQLRGGIIGAVELTGCQRYGSLAVFQADQALHWNQPSWFQPPVMYGFVLANPEILPFQAFPGWFRFFSVEKPVKAQKNSTTSFA